LEGDRQALERELLAMKQIHRSYKFTLEDGSRYQLDARSSSTGHARFTLLGPKYTQSGPVFSAEGILIFDGPTALRPDHPSKLPWKEIERAINQLMGPLDRVMLDTFSQH